MSNILKLSILEKIADKRFQLDAVRAMSYHPAKVATVKRVEAELSELEKQLRLF